MAPKSFSDDGAAGAWGGDGSANSGAIPGVQMNDPGPAPGSDQNFGGNNGITSTGGYSSFSNPGSGDGFRGTSFNPNPTPSSDSGGGLGSGFGPISGGGSDTSSGGGLGGVTPAGTGFSFAEGGAVPDEDGDGDGDNEQDMMAKALQSVDQTLQYTYQKYGLGGGNSETGGDPQKEAAAMPMIPGNQSETPGPYKPGGGGQKTAAAMPMIPGNQSETPGPYQPGGGGQKTAAAMPMIPGNQSETPGPYQPGGGGQKVASNDDGAIDTDDEGSA